MFFTSRKPVSQLAAISIGAAIAVLLPHTSQAVDGTYLNGAITQIKDDQFTLDAFTARAGWNFSQYFGNCEFREH